MCDRIHSEAFRGFPERRLGIHQACRLRNGEHRSSHLDCVWQRTDSKRRRPDTGHQEVAMRSATLNPAGMAGLFDWLRSQIAAQLAAQLASRRGPPRGRNHQAAGSPGRATRPVGGIAGGLAVALAVVLLLGTIMRNQAVLELDGAEASQRQRILALSGEVRSAADMPRIDRSDCSDGPSATRAACLRDAARTIRAALAAARTRHAVRPGQAADGSTSRDIDSPSTSSAPTHLPGSGRSLIIVSSQQESP